MFKKSLSLSLLFAAVSLAGCSRDELASTQPAPASEEMKLPAIVAELERIATSPEGEAEHLAPSARIVRLPAGSVDGLAGAIEAAGPGGIVIVKSGMHLETETVTITDRVNIVGERGAVLVSTTDIYTGPPDEVEPALHVKGASGVVILNLEMKPSGTVGGAAILLENAAGALAVKNKITDYQFGILLHQADNSFVTHNTVAVHPGWQVGAFAQAGGIFVVNGDNVQVWSNDVSRGVFGIFAADESGTLISNRTHEGFIGIILCKVPAGSIVLPGGEGIGSENSATGWTARLNESRNNFNIGYLVIDGANNNMLEANAASNNAAYDMELTADTFRFGFLTPASFENTVIAAPFDNITIKDCGNNNTVIGGQQVDTSVDPCS
jgi:hypothetical protein